MEWQKLELSKASIVKREVDVALQRLMDSLTNPELSKNKLLSAINNRIQELETFYVSNSDGQFYIFLKL